MFFRQVINEDLGCASYVIADAGEAAVVDPMWEVDEYLRLAEEHDFRIVHVVETHNHADHVSGRGRLAKATGASIHISKEAGVDYDNEPLADGDALDVGKARLVALATPGHRPEHMSFIVEDRSRAKSPWAVLTGDLLFVGDLARPDLAIEPDEGARGMLGSLRRVVELGDPVEIWPGHVGGSLCGGAGMSEKPSSTVGFERQHNRFLRIAAEEEFVRALTGELAPQPPNFHRIVELNRGPLLAEAAPLEALSPARVEELIDAGAVVVDAREPFEYDGAHIPRSLHVTSIKSGVGTRAAWGIDSESGVIALAASDEEARRFGRTLEAVGFRRLEGYLAGGIAAWRQARGELESTPALDVDGLAERLRSREVRLLDVREDDEWNRGHVAGSLHVPYFKLREGVPQGVSEGDGKPLAVACSAGVRSGLAASLLRRMGVKRVEHVAKGGIQGLPKRGIELVRD